MARFMLAVWTAVLLAGCADEQVRDQASAAEERAESAHARADDAGQKISELEERVQQLEYNQDL